MERIYSNVVCPACRVSLRPAVLICESCQVRVEGPFEFNEFAALAPDDLHLLRIFVRAEGRIRHMQAALGLSYPTIRTRLTALRSKLAAPAAEKSPVQKILEQLESGTLSYDEALLQVRRIHSSS